jgi:hypothetical protein
MAAALFDTSTLRGRVHAWLENGFSRFVLIKSFLEGDATRAELIGIEFGPREKLAAALAVGAITAATIGYQVGVRLPIVGAHVDRRLNRRLAHLLEMYGHADFVTDADRYRLHTAG